MSTLKNDQIERIEVSVEDGVEWIRHYRKWPSEDHLQDVSNPFYLASYRCDSCGNTWQVTSENSPPASMVPCLMDYCGKPSWLVMLVREMKRQKLSGWGILTKAEAWLWDPPKTQ